MTPDDALLMAYADGQLDAAQAARVEAAIAADPALAEAVARHRALRARLRQAFDPALDEPVPAALLAAARGATRAARDAAPASGPPAGAAPAPAADVASIDAARARRDAARAPRRGPPAWLAMAAVLVVGLAVGLLLGRPATGPVGVGGDGELVARGELAQALDNQLAADAGEGVAIGLSFRDADGRWCRSFRLRGDAPVAGLACRGDDGWRVPVLAESAPEAGGLRQAAADLPPAVLAAIDERLAGDAAGADEERAARDAGWR